MNIHPIKWEDLVNHRYFILENLNFLSLPCPFRCTLCFAWHAPGRCRLHTFAACPSLSMKGDWMFEIFTLFTS